MYQQLPPPLSANDQKTLSFSGFTVGHKMIKTGCISRLYTGTFLSQPIAVKILDLPNGPRVPFLGRYEEYYTYDRYVSKSMKHDHLLKVYDLFIYKHDDFQEQRAPYQQKGHSNLSPLSSVFIFLEYACGGSLADLLWTERSEPFSETEARHYYRQFGEAVCHLHSLGFEHGNIKCEKILFVNEDRRVCKLADFTFNRRCFPPATSTDQQQCISFHEGQNEFMSQASFCPSAAYLAPEVLQSPVSRRLQRPEMPLDQLDSDVWSVGVVLYALLHRRLPFTDWNLRSFIANQLKKAYLLDRNLSIEAKYFIGLHFEPFYEDRPTMSMQMEHEWLN